MKKLKYIKTTSVSEKLTGDPQKIKFTRLNKHLERLFYKLEKIDKKIDKIIEDTKAKENE
jgi:uncharacterized protein YaaN involved in tellurite resistance